LRRRPKHTGKGGGRTKFIVRQAEGGDAAFNVKSFKGQNWTYSNANQVVSGGYSDVVCKEVKSKECEIENSVKKNLDAGVLHRGHNDRGYDYDQDDSNSHTQTSKGGFLHADGQSSQLGAKHLGELSDIEKGVYVNSWFKRLVKEKGRELFRKDESVFVCLGDTTYTCTSKTNTLAMGGSGNNVRSYAGQNEKGTAVVKLMGKYNPKRFRQGKAAHHRGGPHPGLVKELWGEGPRVGENGYINKSGGGEPDSIQLRKSDWNDN